MEAPDFPLHCQSCEGSETGFSVIRICVWVGKERWLCVSQDCQLRGHACIKVQEEPE